jgi:hypothetical protein
MTEAQVQRVVDELMDRMFGELQREQETDERLWAAMGDNKRQDDGVPLGVRLEPSAETGGVSQYTKRS